MDISVTLPADVPPEVYRPARDRLLAHLRRTQQDDLIEILFPKEELEENPDGG